MAGEQGNVKRRLSQTSTNSSELPLKNRYKPLEDTDGMDYSEYPDDTNNSDPNRKQRPGGQKPPPIIVDGTFGSNNTSIQALKNELKETFHYKYANGKTSFYTQNEEDFKKLKSYLSQKQFQFHTFSLPNEKLKKLVLKGLSPIITEDDIKEELKELNFTVEKIHQLSKNADYPLYSLLFSPGTNINEVFKIKTLCYCVISWEKPHKKTNPTQCYRCQKFHHVANNCTRQTKCKKCAGDHSFQNCDKEEELCANCGKKHPANSKECEIFLKVSKKINPPQPTTSPRGSNPRGYATSQHTWPQLPKRDAPPVWPHTQAETNLPSTSQYTPASRSMRPPLSHPPPPPSQDQGGFGNIIQEIKSLFSDLNIPKLIYGFKTMITKIKNAPDGFTKFTILLDSVCEIFDA